jgi:hypothetical protein
VGISDPALFLPFWMLCELGTDACHSVVAAQDMPRFCDEAAHLCMLMPIYVRANGQGTLVMLRLPPEFLASLSEKLPE